MVSDRDRHRARQTNLSPVAVWLPTAPANASNGLRMEGIFALGVWFPNERLKAEHPKPTASRAARLPAWPCFLWDNGDWPRKLYSPRGIQSPVEDLNE
jgi:hypothetical protein